MCYLAYPMNSGVTDAGVRMDFLKWTTSASISTVLNIALLIFKLKQA